MGWGVMAVAPWVGRGRPDCCGHPGKVLCVGGFYPGSPTLGAESPSGMGQAQVSSSCHGRTLTNSHMMPGSSGDHTSALISATGRGKKCRL